MKLIVPLAPVQLTDARSPLTAALHAYPDALTCEVGAAPLRMAVNQALATLRARPQSVPRACTLRMKPPNALGQPACAPPVGAVEVCVGVVAVAVCVLVAVVVRAVVVGAVAVPVLVAAGGGVAAVVGWASVSGGWATVSAALGPDPPHAASVAASTSDSMIAMGIPGRAIRAL